MMRRFFVLFPICTLVVMCSATLAVGQGGAAGVIGRVTDDAGLPVPGVTVTATSPALQVREVTTVTDERGEYRLTPLPIGSYAVTYTLSGFQTVRQEDVRLGAGFVATVNMKMALGTLEETITVTGATPTVDVTSAQTTTRITRETLELLPSNRNGVLSMMSQAPGLRGPLDIPANFTAVPSFRSYGRTAQQWSTLEGVLTAAPSGSSGAANYWDYATFDETQVAGIGKGVESPLRGVQFAAIVKSGGNDFHGSFTGAGTNHKLQGDNLDESLTSRGINSGGKLSKQWDAGGDLGGRIVRDKLWFYGALRRRLNAAETLGVTDPSGAAVDNIQSQNFETVKTSYQTTPSLRFIGYYGHGDKQIDNDALTQFTSWDVRRVYWVESSTAKVESQWVKGNAVLSVQTGAWIYNFAQDTPMDPGTTPRTRDIATQRITGNTGVTEKLNNKEQGRFHHSASLTWYKPNSFKGNHELKVGFDTIPEYNRSLSFNQPSGNYVLLFNNGAPFQIQTNNAPITGHAKSHFTGVYLSDNWTTGRRLTLNLGARLDNDRSWVPEQCQPAGPFSVAACADRIDRKVWNSVAPRVSAVYDLSGNGRSALKMGWGRFYTMRFAGSAQFNNPFTGGNAYGGGTTTYRWNDRNGDRLYQSDEINLDPSGPDYVSGNNFFASGTVSNPPDPNELQPKEDQFFVGFERQLGPEMNVRVTGLYNRYSNVQREIGIQRPYSIYTIPISRPDPGPDGRVGTSDDPSRTLTYWDYPAEFSGAANAGVMRAVAPGEPDQTFKTIELAADRRFNGRWTLSSSFSATKSDAPFPDNSGGADFAIRQHTPNAEINVANNTWEWLANMSFVYQFPHGIVTAAKYSGRSGEYGARQVLLTGGRQVPSLVVNAEPFGSNQLPHIHTVDVRVDKRFRLPRSQSLALKLNVFNVLNANTTMSWNLRSGPSFLLPSSILPARFAELSATYRF